MRAAFASSPLVLAAHGPAATLLQQAGVVDLGLAFDDPSLAWIFQEGKPPPSSYGRVIAWMTSPPPGLTERLRREDGTAVAISPAQPAPGSHVHAASFLLGTLAGLGIPGDLDTSTLRVVPHRTGEILVHPGSGSARKNWPPALFARVTERLLDAGASFSLVVGEADSVAAGAVEAALGRSLPRVEGSLMDLASRLAGARAYLGNDSGVSHLAGLCGTPTYVFFGPTDPRVWTPLGPRVVTLPFDISPDEVVARLLAERAGEVPERAESGG